MKRLSGKNAFISGSSRGIGLACAKALAEQGANVFLVATNEVLLKEATSAIQERSAVQVGFHAVDLRTLQGCQQASNAFNERFGQADILVNSAGATKGGTFPEQSDEEMIETTEEDPIAHQGGPATGGNSTLNLLQSLVPVGRDAPKAAPCLSQASDSIEEPSQTQGARGEAEPEVPGEQTGGAQVLLRSAEDDILSALQVSGRTKTYSSKGGG